MFNVLTEKSLTNLVNYYLNEHDVFTEIVSKLNLIKTYSCWTQWGEKTLQAHYYINWRRSRIKKVSKDKHFVETNINRLEIE